MLLSTSIVSEVTRVALALKNRHYKKGDTIFKEGDKADTFNIIMNGRVEVKIAGKGTCPVRAPKLLDNQMRTVLRKSNIQ